MGRKYMSFVIQLFITRTYKKALDKENSRWIRNLHRFAGHMSTVVEQCLLDPAPQSLFETKRTCLQVIYKALQMAV